MSVAIPEGLDPVGVWDASSRRWVDEHWRERVAWAQQHIPDVDATYRVEFYLIDSPFAVVHRYGRNPGNHKHRDPATGEIARDEPVILPLAELPPACLLTLEAS